MTGDRSFQENLKTRLNAFVQEKENAFPLHETVKVDIHCHDGNSSVPDERLGRMLRWPETWISTEEVLAKLKENKTLPLTVTNHNNAKTCWELKDKGMDVLVGAEFSCTLPDFDLGLHVLAYDFTPKDEVKLNSLRRNLYHYLDYAVEHDIVTVLAHPLFFYRQNGIPPFRYLEKLTLMFDNFEVINGQRDARQNLLIAAWLESLDEEKIQDIAKREKFSPFSFCRHPYTKSMTGGSDCHMALFAGTAGTRFHIPNLKFRTKHHPMSKLVAESLKEGRVAPFGTFVFDEKLTTAFLDYFCQVSLNLKDPGLIRLFLHKGETKEKLIALGILNGMMELKRHNYTSRFLNTTHNALHGKRPGFLMRRITKKDYRPLVNELDKIAKSKGKGARHFEEVISTSLPRIFHLLDEILTDRVMKKLETHGGRMADEIEKPRDIVEKLEMPAYLRGLFSARTTDKESSFADILDGLPFPALAAFVLGGAHFVGARTMHANRPLLEEMSQRVGVLQHPNRVMWLTDTYYDKNGVSRTLQLLRGEVQKRNLPIDFVVVSKEPIAEENIITLKPLAEISTRYYKGQSIRFADILELHRLFVEGGYDRVVCSTEGPMGIMGLYLKYAFSVPAFFYLHTDWLDFARQTLSFERQSLDRIRRMLRAYYRLFDGIFVLNSDHQKALSDETMGIKKERIFLTTHWVKETFRPKPVLRKKVLPEIDSNAPIVMYAGRVSEEKGVFEFPRIMEKIRSEIPAAKMVVCGEGPALEKLKSLLKEDVFLGWVDDQILSQVYSMSEVMLFPSTFDTFGNVVLEAHSCSLPVIAYDVKGPKDIIVDKMSGYLVKDSEEMADRALDVLLNPKVRLALKKGALERASRYRAEYIVERLIEDLGVGQAAPSHHPENSSDSLSKKCVSREMKRVV